MIEDVMVVGFGCGRCVGGVMWDDGFSSLKSPN